MLQQEDLQRRLRRLPVNNRLQNGALRIHRLLSDYSYLLLRLMLRRRPEPDGFSTWPIDEYVIASVGLLTTLVGFAVAKGSVSVVVPAASFVGGWAAAWSP